MIPKKHRSSERKGVAILAFVTALLVIGTMSLWLLHLTATTNSASMGHFYSTGAFYASEGGLEMSLRELNSSPATDIDSDGTIGSISDNGNASDDPVLATGAFYVSPRRAHHPGADSDRTLILGLSEAVRIADRRARLTD